MALDSEGWTILTPSGDSRIIYVSTLGSDSNDGLSEGLPVATFTKAKSLLRDGYPDWILFKRGDTFSISGGIVNKSGRSSTEPMVIGAYGTGERPIINGEGFFIYESLNAGGSGFVFDYVAFVSLDMRASAVSQIGIRISGLSDWILIEDMRFAYYSLGISMAKGAAVTTNLTIRRNSFVENEQQGMLIVGVHTMLVEENIFDKNGWGAGGYGGASGEGPTVFKHNMYLRDIIGLVLRNNITARGSFNGVKLAGNGFNSFTDFTIENNLFYNNPISMSASDGENGIDDFRFNRGTINDNVFTEIGRTFTDDSTNDLCVYTTNATEVSYEGNYFVHKQAVGVGEMFSWGGLHRHLNITISNSVVYDWETGYVDPVRYFEFDAYHDYPHYYGVTNLQLINNDIDLDASNYLDASRTVGKYYESIGGTNDAEAFFAVARDMHRGNWSVLYTADAVNTYIREGYSSPERFIIISDGGLYYMLSYRA